MNDIHIPVVIKVNFCWKRAYKIMHHCFVLYFQWWYNYKFSLLISKKSLLLLKASDRQKSQIFVALCLE